MVMNLIFTYRGRDIVCSVPTFWLIYLTHNHLVCEEQLPVNTEAKNLLSNSAFSLSTVTRLPGSSGSIPPWTSFSGWYTHRSISCSLNPLTSPVPVGPWPAWSHPPQFCDSKILWSLIITFLPGYLSLLSLPVHFFLLFILTSRSQFSHTGLLSSLPDLLHLGIESVCALRKVSLKIFRVCFALLSLRTDPQGRIPWRSGIWLS